jgi:hypothetical protein
MTTWGDINPSRTEEYRQRIQDGVPLTDIQRDIIADTLDHLWMPPTRDRTGHRVSVGNWKPIATRHLNWRWWLAEYPMRILARWAIRQESDARVRGERYHEVTDCDFGCMPMDHHEDKQDRAWPDPW